MKGEFAVSSDAIVGVGCKVVDLFLDMVATEGHAARKSFAADPKD